MISPDFDELLNSMRSTIEFIESDIYSDVELRMAVHRIFEKLDSLQFLKLSEVSVYRLVVDMALACCQQSIQLFMKENQEVSSDHRQCLQLILKFLYSLHVVEFRNVESYQQARCAAFRCYRLLRITWPLIELLEEESGFIDRAVCLCLKALFHLNEFPILTSPSNNEDGLFKLQCNDEEWKMLINVPTEISEEYCSVIKKFLQYVEPAQKVKSLKKCIAQYQEGTCVKFTLFCCDLMTRILIESGLKVVINGFLEINEHVIYEDDDGHWKDRRLCAMLAGNLVKMPRMYRGRAKEYFNFLVEQIISLFTHSRSDQYYRLVTTEIVKLLIDANESQMLKGHLLDWVPKLIDGNHSQGVVVNRQHLYSCIFILNELAHEPEELLQKLMIVDASSNTVIKCCLIALLYGFKDKPQMGKIKKSYWGFNPALSLHNML
ncbi:hypothetical protein ACOME3_007840 [Neoechinorhynchus agilis]